jgi:CRISPR-associated endonuclease Csn1
MHHRLKTVLGLDIGVTSIGWALNQYSVDENDKILRNQDGQIEDAKILAAGVRIFPATTEDKTNAPKNHQRRIARLQRRQTRRKAARRNELKRILINAGLLPAIENSSSAEQFNSLGDPYMLRCKALSEKLAPYEFGRAIYHLSKRRGFLSNRKFAKPKEDGIVYEGIKLIREELESGHFRTLGELLNSKEKKRKYFTHRTMIEDEFEKIWDAQKKYHNDVLTDRLKSEIRRIIFYQRPLKLQRHLIGRCIFEIDKKRCDMARQDAQRIRYWQDINNLQIQDPHSLDWRSLTDTEKASIAAECEKSKEITYKKIRKILKISDDFRINLEANDKKFYGNRTGYVMRKAIGEKWDKFNLEEQDRLVEEMIRINNEFALRKRLSGYWKFSDEEVVALQNAWFSLEDGYSRLSLKAIRKILPIMQQGKRYDEAVREVYGDHRRQFGGDEFQKLPLPPKNLRNPIVYKALCEVRKVINAIIRVYGRPDEIRIEMARELKLTKKQKEAAIKQANKNRKDNEEADRFFQEQFNLSKESVSGTARLKYRLWKEAGERCPYTGKQIPANALLDDNLVDIEHIIPYSKCFDDSYMNKTICDAKFNRDEKKNKAPGEIFPIDSPQYQELMSRIRLFPPAKQRRFKMTADEINNPEKFSKDNRDWIGRLLSDTRYICREVRGYLRQLYPSSPDENKYVLVVAGGATANLRHVWHLNAILADGDVDEKNRWDHRHHAIDAIVVALCDRGLFQYISGLAARNRKMMKRILSDFSEPWPGFLNEVNDVMQNIIVSHAQTRRRRGEILEATAYGPTGTPGVYVRRKPLEALTNAMIKKIADPQVKEIVELRLSQYNGDIKKAFAEPLFHKDGKTPIRSVRLFETISPDTLFGIKDENGKIYKYYPFAGNHHIDIFENKDTGERRAVLVPRFHVNQREWKPDELGPEWNKLFSLHANDYVEFLGDNDELILLRIQKFSGGGSVVIIARPVDDARSDYIPGYVKQLQGGNLKKIVRKLQVDPIGRLAQAGD